MFCHPEMEARDIKKIQWRHLVGLGAAR
jgi:hypothetical protein